MMKKTLSPFERESMLPDLLQLLPEEKLSQGELLMQLRKMCWGSPRGVMLHWPYTELDRENSTLAPLNRALNPLGLKTGLLPRQSHKLETLMLQLTAGENRDDP